jgi:hypothetical protein
MLEFQQTSVCCVCIFLIPPLKPCSMECDDNHLQVGMFFLAESFTYVHKLECLNFS